MLNYDKSLLLLLAMD